LAVKKKAKTKKKATTKRKTTKKKATKSKTKKLPFGGYAINFAGRKKL